MGDCNPACIKIILNGGFMASTARLLSATDKNVFVRQAAHDLALTATAAVEVYEHAIKYGALQRSGAATQFDGCDQATEIVGWVINPHSTGYDAKDIVTKLGKWREELLASMATIVEGR